MACKIATPGSVTECSNLFRGAFKHIEGLKALQTEEVLSPRNPRRHHAHRLGVASLWGWSMGALVPGHQGLLYPGLCMPCSLLGCRLIAWCAGPRGEAGEIPTCMPYGPRPRVASLVTIMKDQKQWYAFSGNRTRVWPVAGAYSTTRPRMLLLRSFRLAILEHLCIR